MRFEVVVESVVVSSGESSGKVDVEVEVGSVRWFVQTFTVIHLRKMFMAQAWDCHFFIL